MKPQLVVLAAGLGRRYGGAKQVEPVGPSGEALVDYTLYDALRAGFGRLVFVVRGEIEERVRRSIGRRWRTRAELSYVRQEAAAGAAPRSWGTGHAVLAARSAVGGPFAVVNADDFYGADALAAVGRFLGGETDRWALAGYQLADTLSPHGHVSRALCEHDADGRLTSIRELPRIRRRDGGAAWIGDDGSVHPLTGAETVSMNLWGFTPDVFAALEGRFEAFVSRPGRGRRTEFGLPGAVGELVAGGRARVTVLPARGPWLGLTHLDDRPRVAEQLRRLVAAGHYPPALGG